MGCGKNIEFGVRLVKLEMQSGFTSKWKCQVGTGIFEPGIQARGQTYETRHLHTQPGEMTFAKLGHNLSKQKHGYLQLSPTQSQASPPNGART